MVMKMGQSFRCTNRSCNCEVIVSKDSETEGRSNPRCCCGSDMKKRYKKPELRELGEAGAIKWRAPNGRKTLLVPPIRKRIAVRFAKVAD
jgi:hypothetical protein